MRVGRGGLQFEANCLRAAFEKANPFARAAGFYKTNREGRSRGYLAFCNSKPICLDCGSNRRFRKLQNELERVRAGRGGLQFEANCLRAAFEKANPFARAAGFYKTNCEGRSGGHPAFCNSKPICLDCGWNRRFRKLQNELERARVGRSGLQFEANRARAAFEKANPFARAAGFCKTNCGRSRGYLAFCNSKPICLDCGSNRRFRKLQNELERVRAGRGGLQFEANRARAAFEKANRFARAAGFCKTKPFGLGRRLRAPGITVQQGSGGTGWEGR